MTNMYLKETILQVVDNQVSENSPPITRETYERLQNLNYSNQQAKEMIAAILLEEMYDVLKNNEPFNEERYTRNLKNLK